MWKKRNRWLLRRGAVRGGSLYSSLCFCICLKFFTVKSFKKNEMSPMCPLYRWTEKTPEAGRKIGGNWGVGTLRFLTMGGSIPGLGLPAWHLCRRLWGFPEPEAWRRVYPIIRDSAFWQFVADTLSHLSLCLWEASFVCLFGRPLQLMES